MTLDVEEPETPLMKEHLKNILDIFQSSDWLNSYEKIHMVDREILIIVQYIFGKFFSKIP
jgi:hypothetical protein